MSTPYYTPEQQACAKTFTDQMQQYPAAQHGAYGQPQAYPAAHFSQQPYAATVMQQYGSNTQPRRQVIKSRKGTNVALHVTLTICTFGVWAFTGWPLAWLLGLKKTKSVIHTY